MSSSKSANAVLAKARAKFGKRLTEKDYASLLSCGSVAEVVAYLKNNTYYSEVLKKINEREVHRGRLEQILKQKLFEDFSSLCIYVKGTGEYFAQFMTQKNDIEHIVHFLTLLSSNSSDEFIFSMPSYFMTHSQINIYSISKARTYDQFFDCFIGTPYDSVLAEFRPHNNEHVNIAEIENKLYKFCYKNLYNSISKYSSGKEREALFNMFDSIMDYMNFVRVYRLKQYYHAGADTTRRFMFPFGTFDSKTVDKLCEADSGKAVFDAVKSTKFGKSLEKLEYVYTGEIDNIGLYKTTLKNMYFSTYPLVVMLSYVFVMQTEYNNIVSIIEGVRYNVDSSKIKSIIIT
ncbi:MAG: V-type ATPase subunit [Clostridia bacterium]|nr:V-type ATPase subunit [Clostridia bacterium]